MVISKDELRERLLAARAALDAATLRGSAAALRRHVLAALAGRSTVAAYVPVGTEPGSVALLDAVRAGGTTVLLPVVTRGAPLLDWAAYDGELAAGPWWLRQPVGPRLGPDAVAAAEVVLVPALAVDRAGNRLGRGAGHYDRALRNVPLRTPVVALLHDGELLDRVPTEPHDRRVTAAATPTAGWVELAAGSRVDADPSDGAPWT